MTDEKILELYLARDERAIHETDCKYGKYLRYIANGIVYNEEDSKEIVNDTYFKSWNAIPPAHPDPLKSFLAKITRRLAINRLEKADAQKRGGGQYLLALEELEGCLASSGSVEQELDEAVLCQALNDFLRSLSVQARRVFIRRYWHLHPIARIAKDLSMSESKVKSMLLRTRNSLKNYLEQEGFLL
ncbi:MAG: sigma-70 family RNA polymerase sigma factor [Clostridia bacterium]|nr:sigma-70 family RNA polymerase sigma factor [Clostridia bacterium]